MAAMRKAGYRNDGQGVFFHKQTGYKFYGWTWTNGAEAWKVWAEANETPAPF